jgi:hypothetical protein
MDYSALIQKIAAEQLHLNPTLRDVMDRVRVAGLHKVAAQMHNVPEFELKTAAHTLGEQLYLQRKRQVKIASGLRALVSLAEDGALPFDVTASNARNLGAVKVANMFRLGPGGIKNLVPEAGQAAAQQASHAMPKTLGPSVAQSAQHNGLFGNVKSLGDDLDLGQTLDKLRNEQMSMGLRPSAPAKPPGAAATPPPAPTAAPKPSQFAEPHPELKALSEEVSSDMRAGLSGPQDVAKGPYGTADEPMWRAIYDETKAREAMLSANGRQMQGMHPSAQAQAHAPTVAQPSMAGSNPTVAPPRRQTPPATPPSGPGATVRLPRGQ